MGIMRLRWLRWYFCQEGWMLKNIRMEAAIRAARGQKNGWLLSWADDVERRRPTNA